MRHAACWWAGACREAHYQSTLSTHFADTCCLRLRCCTCPAAALPWMLDAVDKLQAPSSPPPTDGRGGSGGSNAAGHGRGVAHTLEGGVGVAGEAPGASQQQAAGQGIGPGRPASSGSTQGGSTGSTSGSRAGELRHLRHSGAAEGGAGVGHGIAGGQGTGSTTGGSGTSSVQLLPATMPSHRQLAEEGEGGQGQGQVAEAGEQQEHREPSRLDRLAQVGEGGEAFFSSSFPLWPLGWVVEWQVGCAPTQPHLPCPLAGLVYIWAVHALFGLDTLIYSV